MRNYNESMWDEWNRRPIESALHAKIEMAGIYRSLASQKKSPVLRSSRLWIFRRLRKLWNQSEWEQETPFSKNLQLPEKNYAKKTVFTLPEERLQEILRINRYIFDEDRSHVFLWLAGLWGGGGRQYFPQNGYYVLIRFPEFSEMEKVLSFLRHLEEPIKASSRLRHGKIELMIRDIQSIHSFFVMIKLPLVALRLDEIAVLRSMRDKANKIVNCDNANIKKSLQASEHQIFFCKEAQRLGLDTHLSPEMGELLSLRIDNPTLSLREIGNALKKKVSKSTVEYRLKKIEHLVLQNSPKISRE
ncbi:MAG TPA: DNA-binding protein WhiA [Synergistaceae bacterium]|nr:DNA-binding protein WhiA [Synergistaceae bacterium]HPJ24798.1 DNA-binding protein WhiA [Synergistaceae bacterium]HPQ36237.1 DNA-binding protein WhiA [Synergistaceae bacterium]